MRFAPGLDAAALRRSAVVGAVVAALLLAVGIAFALTQQKTWTAESVVVVLPSTELDDATTAAYYETLSRGQIVATFAEVAGNLRFAEQAEERLGLAPAQREQVTTEVNVVPNTAVILVRATARDAAVAEKVADTTTTLSSEYLAGLAKPYRTQLVHSAQGSAVAAGTPVPLLLAVAVLVALAAGLAVQQAVYHLAVARGRVPDRRERDGAAGQDDAAAASADPAARREVAWGQW